MSALVAASINKHKAQARKVTPAMRLHGLTLVIKMVALLVMNVRFFSRFHRPPHNGNQDQ
jgi:hypothetical protein